jgi:thiopeptide-type bacteriocin biosynthesis protein
MPLNSSSYLPAATTPGTFEATPWLQFQLTLALPKRPPSMANRPDGPAFADWVHAHQMVTTRDVAFRVLRALAPLRRNGSVRAAHFQRKDPGLRWRIASTDAEAVRDVLCPVLDRLCGRGQGLLAWGESVYEPEAPLFGGTHAMSTVHGLFDADTAAWARLTALRRRGELPFTEAALLLAQGNELFSAALGGRPEEVWDTWCRLAVFHDLRPAKDSAAKRTRPVLGALAAHPLAESARDVLNEMAAAQVRAGHELAVLATHGQLEQGLRGVLAAAALFAWNRVGLTTFERRHVLVQAMGAWHPHVEPVLQAA